MVELEFSKKILISILYEDLSFKKALKKHISSNNSGMIKSISGLVGCELRHHLFFESLLKDEYSNDQKSAIYLSLANHFFYKRIQEKEIFEFLENENIKNEEVFNLLKSDKSPIELIPFQNNSIEFISIRFNTPLWLVKMWKKHYGAGRLCKILKANNKPSLTFVNIDRNIDKDDFIKQNKNSITFNNDFNAYEVSPKISYRSFEEYKNNQLINVSPVECEIFNKFHNDLVNEFTIYSGSNDSFVQNLIISLNGNIGMNVVVPDLSTRSSLLRFIRLRNAKNVNLFSGHDEVSFKCGISHKQELVYCYPSSSSFNKIPLYPDYLLHVKQENLDEFISKQKMMLDNCSKFVLEDGLLIYIVDTLSKKESIGIVNDFLLNHQQFSLIEQKQYFPFEKEKTSLFYAVFKLKGASND